MPPRRLTKANSQKHELEAFAEKYDTLALIHGDPVDVVFGIMSRHASPFGDDEIALRAAETLMAYRYPRVKSSEGAAPKPQPVNFNVIMPPAAPPELPVNEAPRLAPRPPITIVTEAERE